MAVWIDAHNHLHDTRLGDASAVIAETKNAGVIRCVANAVRESDWPVLARLAENQPGWVLPAYGIHPWQAHKTAPGWQERLEERLKENPDASVGECGLDGWVDDPSIDVQMPVFLDQLRIARKLERPATIHALKAWEPLFEAFEQEAPPPRFLMHSFAGSIELAQRLLLLGAYFSFSGYFLHERKAKVREMFALLPADRILLETDAPDMSPPAGFQAGERSGDINHPADLPLIGRGLARILGLSPEELARQCRENFEACFG